MDYNGYCVRVDARDGYAEKMLMLKSVADYEAIVAVKHKGASGENPHYHLIVKTNVKDQAFRVRMRKVFDQGKGNGHMSIKPWDGNIDAISYLFHEDDDNAKLIVQYNITDETIEKAKARNREVKDKVAIAKERASWRLEEEVYQQVVNRSVTDDEIAKAIILTSLRSGKYMPNDYLIKSMVTRIQFRLLNGDVNAEEQFADGIVWRLYHKYD